MSSYREHLGFETVQQWAEAAKARPVSLSEEEIARRKDASEQMLAIMRGNGMAVSDEVIEDQKMVIYGQMDEDEFKAYLEEKYKPSST